MTIIPPMPILTHVMINGWQYKYDESGRKLYTFPLMEEVPMQHLTANEKEQIETWVKYGGVPMVSF